MEERSVRVMIPDQVPDGLKADGVILPEGGRLYLRLNGRALCCPDTPEGLELLTILADGDKKTFPGGENRDGLLRRLLAGTDPSAAEKLNGLYRIPLRKSRCVMIFKRISGPEIPLFSCLKELAPVEEQDLLLETGKGYTALIRSCDEPEEDEQREYAMALAETVKEETGMELRCGIGTPVPELERLPESCGEAMTALRLAKEFRRAGSVFTYGGMMTEQILSCIPAEKRRELHGKLFNEKNRHLLSGEMKETVEMFFRSDLNLSDTARQMFIHRNTLTYRLEKIKKETGLDLRHFEDAVTFRILSELAETEEHEANG